MENKDSYFRLKAHEITEVYDCVIFGEGWKITSSFSLAEEHGIMRTDWIDYFGDMDPEGFLIYQNLKEKYVEYKVGLQTEFYKKTIEAAKDRKPGMIKSIVTEETMQRAEEVLADFDDDTAAYLKKIMREGQYIPQEAFVLSLLDLS